MNFWAFSFLLANLIWGIFYERSFLKIFMLFFFGYLILSLIIAKFNPNSFRRKVQIATWDNIGEPVSFLRLEVDMGIIDSFLKTYNEKNPGNKISLTLIFAKAIGLGLAQIKSTFGKISFGCMSPSPTIDLSFTVDVNGENLASAKVVDLEKKSFDDLATQFKGQVKEYKTGTNKEFNKRVRIIEYVPSFIVQLLMRVSAFFTYDLNKKFWIGNVEPNQFGYGLITNIINFEICDTFAPIVPMLRNVLSLS